MAEAEEQRKKSNKKFGGDVKEKEFSLPTQPKKDVKAGSVHATKDRVTLTQSFCTAGVF